MSDATPINATERIESIDIIRGFALFGVLWLNLVAQSYEFAPDGAYDDLATASLDALIEPIAALLVSNKAMTLFSLLFGYGFAMIISRLESRGVNAKRIFIRRMAILFVFGIIHILLVWPGDILHLYALMGLLLYFTRHWSDRLLLAVGLSLALASNVVTEGVLQFFYEEPYPWWSVYDEGAVRRFEVFQQNNYFAYVVELWRAARWEMWGTPDYIPYCTNALGRFMIGAWIFRQGWLQNAKQWRDGFRRAAIVLLGSGLLIGMVISVIERYSDALAWSLAPLSQLTLALGYGAIIVVACESQRMRAVMLGLAAVGRMALTNYLLQSLMYVFVLFGFGLGLLDVLGATLCLSLAVVTFLAQIWFSVWWLQRFRFGPMEWLWRSLTYRQPQPFRLAV